MGAEGRQPGQRSAAEQSLAVRAAWLHYAGGLTQAEVAARLGVSAVKAHRLVQLANQIGAVRVSVEGDVVECLELEAQLSARHGLTDCRVVPDLGEEGLPLRALGPAGAQLLERAVHDPAVGLIGLGHGRTLAAAIAALPRLEARDTRFVSLLGGLTRNYAANPHDVMHQLSAKTRAEAYVMPVPFFANTPADREVLMAQHGVAEVAALARQAALYLVGIGTVRADTQLVASRMVNPEEIHAVAARGGCGEMLGHFFDATGAVVDTPLSARTVAPPLSELGGRRVVAIAGGPDKTEAIAAVLKSGHLSGLITDEASARALLARDAA
ncbi:sugar-binding transcriptional regulator [Roseivivax sp. GX 12232]|uniref:sugar-binding transcriptional regulator n=1 Tax=Roseivivax sp. GX 12232 TaxID=2900547 RepID=UPI001E382347|nr:sugar-binding transcriptional regulator [Roseivivax sp. GX 12232]MCE0505853.1 sugar-binding transcriptional regulator [Roseivivax sp. GX 12232]